MKKLIIFTLILLGSCHMHVAYCMKKKTIPRKTKNDFIEKLKNKILKTIDKTKIDEILTAEFRCRLEIDNIDGKYFACLLFLRSASGKIFNSNTYLELPDEYLTEQISINPEPVYDKLYYEIDNIVTLDIRNGFE